jgi:membrane-associated protease RseP (regulator of RpoE activity)
MQRYYDENDQPVAIGDGEFGRRIKNDEQGRETYVEFLGPDGQMQNTKAGYAFYQNLWDLDDRRWYNSSQVQVLPLLQVTEIADDSNAAKSGIEVGDEILKYSDQYVANIEALRWLIRHASVGEISVDVRRNGKRHTLKVSNGPLGIALREQYVPVFDIQGFSK